MEKKIEALKAAYASKDAAKLRSAALSIIAYSKRHPLSVCMWFEAGPIVGLAEKIVAATA